MRRLILSAVLALSAYGLSACAPPSSIPDDMRSVVLFDMARFEGTWRDISSGATWQITDSALTTPTMQGALSLTGPGRMSVSGSAAPLWVLWVDEGYRTVVIGTPDRSFAYILNRGGDIAPDRLRAAREILEWNGYDIGAAG